MDIGSIIRFVYFAIIAVTSCAVVAQETVTDADASRIQPYKENPRYWQYRGKPVLLLGGSKDDNLFQIPDIERHLDMLVRVGGNYVRNTMSSRSDQGFEIEPFKKLPNGKYDLDQWNEEYWNRFEKMLKLTHDRNIVVQIEIWAFHDFNNKHWENNPWRAANNINYSKASTRLKDSYGNIGKTPHDFFFTVPGLKHDDVVLAYQQRYVDRLLSHSLKYDHVLYCMTNEIHPPYSPEWGRYWSRYVKARAAAMEKKIETTEMYWETTLMKPQQRASLDFPDVFSYFEGSQNSAKMGQHNWDNLQFVYHYLANAPRPVNHVKIYGADTSTWEGFTDRHATESFWRNIIGGSASSRFHRPPYGLGLNSKAQQHITSMRLLMSEMDLLNSVPDSGSLLLSRRSANEAYLSYVPRKQYTVYFPDGGSVDLDLSEAPGQYTMKSLDIARSKWSGNEQLEGGGTITLTPPGPGPWAILISRIADDATKPEDQDSGYKKSYN